MNRSLKIKNNTALSFNQSGDFYYNRAMKFLDRYEYDKAVYNIKKAIDIDKSNIDYTLDLAGILSEIEHYDDSNDLLFSLLQDSETEIPECYYGIGCNFLGLNDYGNASSALIKYIKLCPDGEYAEDAEEMLEDIDYDLSIEETDEKLKVWQNVIQYSDSKKTIELLSKLSDVSLNEHILINNNLTAAYVIENQLDKATQYCNKVLSIRPNNIHALCNMSLINIKLDKKDEARIFIRKAMSVGNHAINELKKISIVLCELDMHHDAVMVFETILEDNPYDLQSRHFAALAYYNLGKYKKSLSNFDFISKFKPESSVNNWYRKLIFDKVNNQGEISYLPYTSQISSESIYERIKKINDIVYDMNYTSPWSNIEFKELVMWAFDIKDNELKTAMVSLIAKYAGDEASDILKQKLYSRHVSDEIKHKILLHLKKIDAKQPYIAILNNALVEVNVDALELKGNNNFINQKAVLQKLTSVNADTYGAEFLPHVIGFLNFLVANSQIFDNILDYSTWAALIEYEYIISEGLNINYSEIAKKYGVDLNTVISLMDKIRKETNWK